MDRITLTGIRSYGYLGVFPEEQTLGQWFEVNVTLGLDLQVPGQSDDLRDTVDYGQVVQGIQTLVESARFALLERLASAIADFLLQDPRVQQVEVAVTKLHAPIPHFSGQVTVQILRSKC